MGKGCGNAPLYTFIIQKSKQYKKAWGNHKKKGGGGSLQESDEETEKGIFQTE
jgi:hypothetical protein